MTPEAIIGSIAFLYGDRMASTAMYTLKPIFIGIFDFDDLEGTLRMTDVLCRLMTSGKKCGVYYDLGVCILCPEHKTVPI